MSDGTTGRDASPTPPGAHGDKPRRPKRTVVEWIVFCTGKVFYAADAERRARGVDRLALVRIEQLYPYPETDVLDVLAHYPGSRIAWLQEEPANMGAASFIQPRLSETADMRASIVARGRSASTAAGSQRLHQWEQDDLMERLFSL